MKTTIVLVLAFALSAATFAQHKSFDELDGADIRIYKTVDGYDLKMNIVYPDDYIKGKRYPAIIFFFGGGWASGTVQQFDKQCHFLASRGMIAMAANYRVRSRNNSTPYDAVEDAKSAIRWVRIHAKELGVNINKIVASGGSAGGHLAACTAMVPGYESAGEKIAVSSKPNALVLFNPAINVSHLSKRFGKNAAAVSPIEFVKPNLPPTIIFHGTADKTVPFATIDEFAHKMEAAGNVIYVVPFTGQGHGFFNYGRSDNKFYELTMRKTESFLRELNYIK